MTDDQEDTGSMAYMPKTLSLIAEHGVTFKNSFVNLPLCGPSRASFLTGQAAHNHGIRANSPLDRRRLGGLQEQGRNALPVWLQAAGYKTALIGKYLNRYGQQSLYGAWLGWFGGLIDVEFKGTTIGNPRDWVPPGWDLWYAFSGTRPKYYDYSINDNGKMLSFGIARRLFDRRPQRARRPLHSGSVGKAKLPSFMFVAPKSAHAEGDRAIPSPQYKDRPSTTSAFRKTLPSTKRMCGARPQGSARRPRDQGGSRAKTYRAALRSLQSVDDLVAAVVGTLKDTGKLDNTVVIYTSDNGFLFGDHRLIGKTAAYEGSIKVPLLMRGPGIPEHQTRDQLVSNLDVVATIVDLAGAKPGVALDGKSLKPLFADADAPWRSALLIESPVTRFERESNRYAGVRTATKKYVRYEGGFEELFDLAADPTSSRTRRKIPPIPAIF